MRPIYTYKPQQLLLLLFGLLVLVQPLTAQELPKYLNAPIPQTWSVDSLAAQPVATPARWWTVMADPQLDSLISVGIERNRNLLAAINRIEMAKANFRIAQSAFYPSFMWDNSWTKAKQSGQLSSQSSGSGVTTSYFTTAISSSWEIDVFGAIRKNAQSQKELYRASQEDYSALVVSLSSQIAVAYAQLRTAQQSLLVAQQNLESQQKILAITEGRFKSGLATSLDVAQAKVTYFSTQASLPAIETSISNAINSIALLLGDIPSHVRGMLSRDKDIPNYYHLAAIGKPEEIIANRPDIRAAARTVDSYASALGASKRDWYPKVLLNSSVGYSAHEFDRLGNHKSLTYQLAPAISWTIFNGGQRVQAIKAARAQLDESINQYNETVLTAIQEVESAITQYTNALKQVKALKDVVNQAQIQLRLSLEQYKDGLSNFQNVQTAQVSLLSSQSQLISAEGGALEALIQLYNSLGGGANAASN